MIKYRVVIKVSYNEAWFEYDGAAEAVNFASNALSHMVSNEDAKKPSRIAIEIVNTGMEEEEDEEDD